jgi:hypothetical protein
MLGYYEEAVGLGQPETLVDNLSAIVMQFALGGAAATLVSPKDKKYAIIEGGIAAVAAGQVAQALFPMGGVFYWLRNAMVPGGAGVLVGLHQQKQWEQDVLGSVAADPYLARNPKREKPIWERWGAEQEEFFEREAAKERARLRKLLCPPCPKC